MSHRVPARTSVVIAARNAGQTLAQTLDSLLAQTDPDWQAFIVDDRSTDETPALIAQYAQRDARFVSLQGPGVGAAAARNIGLSQARGQRLLFLDSDDWIDARFLELMNAALGDSPGAVAAYCGYRRVMPDGELSPTRSSAHIAQAPFEAFMGSCAAAIHAILIERDLIARAGDFDTTLRTCEDWDLWQRAARLGGTWVHVDQALSFYRASAHSLTQDVDRMLTDARTVIRRGFAADGRLTNVPVAHLGSATIAQGASAALAHAYFALWCAAFDCGRGGSGVAAFKHLVALAPTLECAQPIVDVLLDGVMVGLRAVPKQIARRWPEFGPGVTALLSQLGTIWSDPLATRRIQYRFERAVLDYDDLADHRPLSLTLGLRVNLHDPAPVIPPPGIDRLYVYLCDDDEVFALYDLGALGTITTRDWLELALRHLDVKRVARSAGPALLRSLTPASLGSALRGAAGTARTASWHSRPRGALSSVMRATLVGAAGPSQLAHSHRECLDAIRGEATRSIAKLPRETHDSPADAGRRLAISDGGDRRAYWEYLFEKPDPWNYGSDYEQEKYARQLALLPQGPIERALELACAEGRFTEKLAPRVGHLIASDISAAALARALERCRAHANVEFRPLDLVVDALPQDLDLIVCSEVLYYLESEVVLQQVSLRFAAALKPGGHLLIAHAFVLQDDPSHTGFDWEHRLGARTIARVFASTSRLALERSLHTELYGIDLFVRVDAQQPAAAPKIEYAPITAKLETEVARQIVWGGAIALRAELVTTEQRTQVPVLAYHRIGNDGPVALARYRTSPEAFRAQMHWLRRNGYHSITSEQLLWFLEHKRPFVGRPVVITFDDGLQDFADVAWPILRSHDFGAEVFVVTDLVGQAATWDCELGEPAPLMDAATLVRLASEGVSFGSHLATHRGADGLSTRELVEELARSRAALQQWLDRPIETLAAPFGLTDGRLRMLAAQCGYRVGYGTQDGVAQLTSDPQHLPRIEVQGNWTLADFIARMEANR